MILEHEAKLLFTKTYGAQTTRTFFSHGRLELLGNHTDHNHGLCLVGGVDMGITAVVAPRNDAKVEIISQGYRPFSFDANRLEKVDSEEGTSLALTKGVMAKMKEKGYRIGGFSAALDSDIFPGAGVSSSACYESLIVKIIDALFNNDDIDPLLMAQIGQYAENVYFGKPSGLLDQIGTSFGGVAYIDFHDIEHPTVIPTVFDFPIKVLLVNTPSSHANLTPLYASIPADMKAVAQNGYGVSYLGDLTKEQYFAKANRPIPGVSERAKLRATHFFDENERVAAAFAAIKRHDAPAFLANVNASGKSSTVYLANTMPPGIYQNSPQQALDYAASYIGEGAIRIMGGGFAGSIICFVLPTDYARFKEAMVKGYGEKNVHEVDILDKGPREY